MANFEDIIDLIRAVELLIDNRKTFNNLTTEIGDIEVSISTNPITVRKTFVACVWKDTQEIITSVELPGTAWLKDLFGDIMGAKEDEIVYTIAKYNHFVALTNHK